ncbi:UNVERIFIED_CONTAM: hypothetical protein HDU68_004034 [Siphonaria sp. JEL0065]|nr:hypothetical protein HDU68_004034 [Siphonaria sp. JEL0065]
MHNPKPLSRIELTIDDVSHHQNETENEYLDRDDETLIASDDFDFDDLGILNLVTSHPMRPAGSAASTINTTQTGKSKAGKRILSSVSPISRKRTHVLPEAPLSEWMPQHQPPPSQSSSSLQSQRQPRYPASRSAVAGVADPVRGMDGIETANRIREGMSVADRIGAASSGATAVATSTRRVTRNSVRM